MSMLGRCVGVEEMSSGRVGRLSVLKSSIDSEPRRDSNGKFPS